MDILTAKKMIKIEAMRLGLQYEKISGKAMNFDGYPANTVTLTGFVPDPKADDLQKFARQQKIVLTIVTNQGISS